jgi:hypothetical protein
MSIYGGLNTAATSGLQSNMNDPYSAMGYNTQMAQGNQQIFGQSQQNNQGLVQSLVQRGINPNSPMFAMLVNQASRSTKMAQSGLQNNLMLQAQNLRQGSASAGMQFQPLQTGTKTTQGTSGVGAWV